MDKNRVIWQEGLFLRPQHFQQQERFMLDWVENRCKGMRPYNWGFTELVIDKESLSLGKLALHSCQGVFPDGTPFDMSGGTMIPEPLEVTTDMRDTRVYLGLPLYRPGVTDVADNQTTNADAFVRYRMSETKVRDIYTVGMDDPAELQVGSLRPVILTDQDNTRSYSLIPLAHIQEKSNDQQVSLDPHFIPTVMQCGANQLLSGFIREIQGLLGSRGAALARMVAPGAGGVAEVANFLQLQLVNRYEPLFQHLAKVTAFHPEDFYRLTLLLAGEMATFSRTERRPQTLPEYRHDNLMASFLPVMKEIRYVFSKEPKDKARQLEITEHNNNYWAAIIADETLLDSARFVLAAKAQLSSENLTRDFPRKTTVSSIDNVAALVRAGSRGITLKPMQVSPQQIPIHAGFTYFELDKSADQWQLLASSAGLGFHIPNFPGLELELWAILS